jgi:hypothetical protein
MARKVGPEASLMKAVLQLLKLRGVFFYRQNTGAVQATYKGRSRYVRFGAVGAPDIVCVIRGRYVGIELKAGKGKQTEDQLAFQVNLEKAGGAYLVVRDAAELATWLTVEG